MVVRHNQITWHTPDSHIADFASFPCQPSVGYLEHLQLFTSAHLPAVLGWSSTSCACWQNGLLGQKPLVSLGYNIKLSLDIIELHILNCLLQVAQVSYRTQYLTVYTCRRPSRHSNSLIADKAKHRQCRCGMRAVHMTWLRAEMWLA